MTTAMKMTVVVCAALSGVTFAATSAHAVEWGMRLEPGMAAAAGDPQSRMFGAGGAVSAKGLIGIRRYLDAQVGITYVGLGSRAGAPATEIGGAWGYGGGLRLKLPHDTTKNYSPWLDADVMYVRTGPLNRFGYSLGAGVSVALDGDHRFWLGPFIRYLQIVQGDHPASDNSDAKLFIVGASLEFGPRHRRAVATVACTTDAVTDRDRDGVVDTVDKCPDQPGPAATYGCPDRDGDGVADIADVCPDVPGPIANSGCPLYKKIVVRPDRLELKEKIMFSWDSAVIEPQSDALLDEVVQALNDNKSLRVRIEGHTDSSGKETHNQILSEQRARAVLDYLATHGIDRDRLAFAGFSSSQPLDRNDTEAGREANRRVEFVVQLVILKDRGKQ